MYIRVDQGRVTRDESEGHLNVQCRGYRLAAPLPMGRKGHEAGRGDNRGRKGGLNMARAQGLGNQSNFLTSSYPAPTALELLSCALPTPSFPASSTLAFISEALSRTPPRHPFPSPYIKALFVCLSRWVLPRCTGAQIPVYDMADPVYSTQPMPLSSSNGSAVPADNPENLKANAVNSEVCLSLGCWSYEHLLTIPQYPSPSSFRESS